MAAQKAPNQSCDNLERDLLVRGNVVVRRCADTDRLNETS